MSDPAANNKPEGDMDQPKTASRRPRASGRTANGKPLPDDLRRRRSRLYRRMYAESPIGIVLYDHEGHLVAANRACLTMVGMPRHFDVSRWFADMYADPTVPDAAKKDLRRKRVARYEAEIDYDDLKKQGVYHGGRAGVCYVAVVTAPIRQTDGKLIGYMTQVQDVTDLKIAQKMLTDYQLQLRSLSSQLCLAEEKERRQLAAGLHDNVGQTLALIRFRLSEMASKVSDKSNRARVAEIRALVDEAADRTRALTFELSPPVLYELGLEPALEWLAEQYHAKYGIGVQFRRSKKPLGIGEELRGLLFSSVRELLMNAIKHSRARAVRISVTANNGDVSVTVKDNGVGFDLGKLRSGSGGFGLFNIRERMTGAGGQMEVDSRPGRGTTVTLTVPLQPSAGETKE